MSKLPYAILLTATAVSLLSGCESITAQPPNTAHATQEPSQQQRESQLHKQADNAIAEMEGKKKPHSTTLITPPPKPQLGDNTRGAKNLTEEPSWVMTPPTDNAFVFGVGAAAINATQAAARQIADDQAKVNLIAKLRVTISGENISHERVEQGLVSQSFSSAVRSTVKPTVYSGLNIIERYIDKQNNTIYALAALHRQTALEHLQQQIILIDQQLLAAQNHHLSGSAIKQLQQALPVFKQLAARQQLNQQVLDVSSGQQQFALSPELKKYQAYITATIDQLQFKVINGDDLLLRNYLIKTLTEQGIRVNQQGQADVVLHYRIDWQHTNKNKQHYQFANCIITLQDAQGRVLSSYIEKAKGVSSVAGLAKNKAQEKLAQQLSQSLGANLLNAIN